MLAFGGIMDGNVNMLFSKLSAVKNSFTSDGIFNTHKKDVESPCAAFVSVCDANERAFVFRAVGNSRSAAWDSVCEKAADFVRKYDHAPVWVKGDIMAHSERVSFQELLRHIAQSRNESFRRGIAFDDGLETALIEAEINGNRVISYKKHSIELVKVNKYLSECGVRTLAQFPGEVTLFDCESRFCDENGAVFPLNDSGRRVTKPITVSDALGYVASSSEYLSMQVRMDGRFEYGCYPIDNLEVPGYNILRHAGAVWALVCACRLTGDKFTMNQVIKATGYLVANTYRLHRSGNDVIFLADREHGEVKVGGNALAVIALVEYMELTGSDKYAELCRGLGNGILELFDRSDGSFWHVLDFPQMTRRERFRTVYYDGEAVFALCRLYGLTHENKWLEAAAAAADRLIREGYEKHCDHWVSYAFNELTKFLPEERYLSFGLKNAAVNLQRIRGKKTTHQTYLELLCASFEIYSRIRERGLECGYMREFPAGEFVETIFLRAEYMLNGCCFPEFVMYLKYPSALLGAFFVRQDGFRIRIDDIQHYCGAYCAFCRNYDRLTVLRNSFRQE